MVIEDQDDINAAVDEALDALNEEVEITQDDNADEAQEEVADETESDADSEEVEADPKAEIEKKARDGGWVPKDKYKGNPDLWVDAEEFVVREPLYKKIGTQSKEIKALKRQVEATTKFLKDRDARVRQEAIAEIESRKLAAVEYADLDAYKKAEEDLKAKQAEEEFKLDDDEEVQAEPEIPDFVQEFAKANDWFEKDPVMTQFMVVQTGHIVASEGIPLEDAIKKAKAEVIRRFPEKFENPKKNKPSAVMGKSQEQRPTKMKISNLTKEQRDVYQALRSTMSETEFLNEWEKTYGTP